MHADSRPRARAGFTLLELVAALSLTGLLLLGALLLVEEGSLAGESLARYASVRDSSANGTRLLQALAARARSTTDSARAFSGEPARASFESWCERPGGWLERCRVTMELIEDAGRTSVVLTLSTGGSLVPAVLPGGASFRYYGAGAADTGWVASWGESMLPPLAIGLTSAGDTLVLRTATAP